MNEDMPDHSLDWAVASAVSAAQNSYLVLYPVLLVLLVGLIVVLSRQSLWTNYADVHKWQSRMVLVVVTLATIYVCAGTGICMYGHTKGRLSPEFPSLTATAIKIGVEGLLFQRQLATQIPTDQLALYNCVFAISLADGQNYLSDCKNSPACIRPIPPLTRESIMSEIRDIKSGKIASQSLQVCNQVKFQ
jgi:hypothetical protein